MAAAVALVGIPIVAALPSTAAEGLDLSQANRRAPIAGLYDWSKSGFRGGADLPDDGDLTADANCRITPAELAADFDVRPDDGADDSAGLQAAIDAIRTECSPDAGYDDLSLISLPAGTLDVSRQLGVDADYLVLRGAGSDPATGTRIVFRPDENTRYDALTPDGSDWDEDGMTHGAGKGGWIWPGRGLFRVQSRQVHSSYASDYASAPANRRDIFEGTVNVHWKSGLKLRGKPGDSAYAARAGDRVVHLGSGSLTNFGVGGLVNIRAANTMDIYAQQEALPTEWPLQNLHMRQQIFTITAVDTGDRTITVDKPLEYDVPVTSTSDGSAPINGDEYASKAAPLVDPVLGVGFENLSFTQDMPGLDRVDAVNNYGNMAPAYQMHGIVFKWAANSWVRGVRAEMTGSHPIVTEEAKNLQIVDNHLDGSWNKGKGGNGYFRGSRVWDSLYAGNVSRNLRHFTFQWSASGNVVIGNDFDSDLNLHGGWERNNLFELNTVRVPHAHRSGNCADNCGGEGGTGPDDSDWFPIWWGAGKKAVKWSGSSGPHNVFFNNTMTKQLTEGGPYVDYYADRHRIYEFGWDGDGWQHLEADGTPISDWAHNEQRDYTGGSGVVATKTDPGQSLFLKSVDGTPPTDPPTTDPPATEPPAPTGLTATFAKPSAWDSGYTGEYTITNHGDTEVDGWTLEFDLPDGSRVSNSWSSTRTSTGQHHSFTNATWNADIAPGASETFGFTVAGTGDPLNCTINGSPCQGGGGDDPPPGDDDPPPPGDVVNVSTADELEDALANAQPGQTIQLAAGTYTGVFRSQRDGTAADPITLTGPRDAVLVNDGPSGEPSGSCPAPADGYDSGYGLWLFDAPHWNLTGFTVADSKKGIVLDNSQHVTIDGVHVHHIEEEGVHFRRSSADGVVRDSRIDHIGLVKPQYGEGVYIGSAKSNFDCHGNSDGMDRSDRVQVLDNHIGPYVAAEHIDIKEGTADGVVRGNTFDGQGIAGQNSADSWIDVKGNDYLIEHNTGSFRSPGVFANGYETHNPLDGYGCGNVWRDNHSDLANEGDYAIRVSSVSKCRSNPNVVYSSNTVVNAREGLTNIDVTP